MLDPQPGDLVLDACAAPGGKTAAIAEKLAGRGAVLAIDRHPRRLGLVARTIRRLGLKHVHTLERDAAQSLADLPTEWLDEIEGVSASDGLLFDRVLVDAPCTGLGTLRRNPDARWRLEPDSPAELARLQLSILQNAAATLRPGGTLVYSTCTLLPEENEKLVNAFLDSRPEFSLSLPDSIPAALAPVLTDEGFLRCLPHVHDTDGFFAARMERAR
jgi:16S rRNA (cytosine967-C5)-methyltransferase